MPDQIEEVENAGPENDDVEKTDLHKKVVSTVYWRSVVDISATLHLPDDAHANSDQQR